MTMEKIKYMACVMTMLRHKGNMSHAAKELEISIRCLRTMCRRWDKQGRPYPSIKSMRECPTKVTQNILGTLTRLGFDVEKLCSL